MTFDFLENFQEIIIHLAMAGLIFFFIEKLRPTQKRMAFFKKDFRKELGLAMMNGAIFNPLFSLAVTFVLIALLGRYVPYQIFDAAITKMPLLAQALAGAFIMDLSTYWRHRFTHRYLWPYHSVHHSAEEINWLTALRMHPVDLLFGVACDIVTLHILGFSGPGIAFAAVFITFYNHFVHSNIDLEYDWPLNYIFASPNFHRWHHATDKKAYDKNFCSVFSCLDLMFGTYFHPTGKLPGAYGLSPAEQKETPPGLARHLIHPFRKNFQSIMKKNQKKRS